MLDKFLPYSVWQVLIPFLSPYRPLWVGIGVIAFYLTLLVTITFYMKAKIGASAFRKIHYLSFIAYFGATFHGLYAGTDSVLPLANLLYKGTLLATLFLTVYWLIMLYFRKQEEEEAKKREKIFKPYQINAALLKQGGESTKPGEEKPAGDIERKEEDKPQSSLDWMWLNLSLVSSACAAEKVADDLAVEMSSMPEVLKAYDEIKARLPQLNALRDSGAVGEGKQGLLKILDKKKLGSNEALVNAVNDNRKIVITGMAKAILKINKQPQTKAALNQVMAKAAATYADIQRENARQGWWIELVNGKWVQK